MSVQLSTTVRNARLDQIESTISTSPVLRIYTTAPPANCAAANSGTVLATITCPSDWLNAASSGAKTIAGSWADTDADAAGTAGHFRIYESTATTCHIQGTVTASGGGGDMTLDNAVIALHQSVTISTFTLTDGNV